MIEVLQPGIYSTIQDSGRRGYEAYGMPASGMFDSFLAGIANKLAGNPPDSAVLEFALVGPSLRFTESCAAAVAGLHCEYLLNGIPVEKNSGFMINAGSILTFGRMEGWFGYLAISGGFQRQAILNSVSDYPSGDIGSRLQKGQSIDRNQISTRPHSLDNTLLPLDFSEMLEILPAIHTSEFEQSVLETFCRQPFSIHSQSNRMGIRLNGPAFKPPEITRSVPALPGTIQVTPSGEPIILGPEGPTTGGYPQIGILTRTSWTTLAYSRPGLSIRFGWTNRDEARKKWEKRIRVFQTENIWKPVN